FFDLSGQTFGHASGPVRLPSGESTLTVYLVTQPNEWQQVATLPLRVTTSAGFESASAAPRVDLADNGQFGPRHQPPSNAPARSQFQDLTLGLGLQSQLVRRGVTLSTQTNLVGVTNETQAPAFALEGRAASRVDLADYAWTIEHAAFNVSIGQGTFSA